MALIQCIEQRWRQSWKIPLNVERIQLQKYCYREIKWLRFWSYCFMENEKHRRENIVSVNSPVSSFQVQNLPLRPWRRSTHCMTVNNELHTYCRLWSWVHLVMLLAQIIHTSLHTIWIWTSVNICNARTQTCFKQ